MMSTFIAVVLKVLLDFFVAKTRFVISFSEVVHAYRTLVAVSFHVHWVGRRMTDESLATSLPLRCPLHDDDVTVRSIEAQKLAETIWLLWSLDDDMPLLA